MSDLELMRGVRALLHGGATQLDDDTLEKIAVTVNEVVIDRGKERRRVSALERAERLLGGVVPLNTSGSFPLTCWGVGRRHAIAAVELNTQNPEYVDLISRCGYRALKMSPRHIRSRWRQRRTSNCRLCQAASRPQAALRKVETRDQGV